MSNETVSYNGKQINRYEASQMQRGMERQIRQDKKDIAVLQRVLLSNNKDLDREKIKQELNQAKINIQLHNTILNDFIEQTGFRKDYSRLQVAKNNSTKPIKSSIISKNANKKEDDMKYQDITNQYTTKKKYQLKKQKYFIGDDGTKYNVDGKYVILEPTQREIEVAGILGEAIGGRVNIVPKINKPFGIKTSDYIINDEKFDLKQITGKGKYAIQGNLKGKEKQSNNFVIDISNAKFDITEAHRQIENIYNSKHYLWINKIVLLQNNNIIKVYKKSKK